MAEKKDPYRHTFLKYGGLVAGLYAPAEPADTIIIIAKGALSPGDMGKDRPYEKIAHRNIPTIIPDYYGHFRSSGTFTPDNCARTIIDTMRLAQGKLRAYDVKKRQYVRFHFKNIIVVGSSFGGWIPGYINTFFPKDRIGKIGLVAPLIDFKDQASAGFPGEESMEQFLFMGRTIYADVYRGIGSPVWKKFLFAKDPKLDPMENLEALADCQVAIVHGKKDTVIDHSRSEKIYEKLKRLDPKGKYLKLMPNVGHSSDHFPDKLSFIVEKLLK